MSYKRDPGDKEVNDDDDDDDRNHMHRRRDDVRSQSFEDEVTEHIFTKPYRNLCGGNGSQSNETWKKYSLNPLEKEIPVKFDHKRLQLTQLSRGPSELNRKSRVNQPFSSHHGAVRGSSQWSSCEPRFSSVDITSQMVQGIPNGGLDVCHPPGLQGRYKTTTNPFLNMGLTRQQCRDFEEQGFCLRGDMCPMEHGMNRIIVEDVQSLSQFNIPISLKANSSIPPAGTGPTSAASVVTNTLSNSKGPHENNIKNGIGDIDSAADFYDPDQPLWSNDSHTSTGFQSISQPNTEKICSLLDHGLSAYHHGGQSDGSDNENVTSSEVAAHLKTRYPVQGRITSIKKRTEMRENIISKASPSNFLQNETVSNGTQYPPHHQKLNNSDASLNFHSGNGRINSKPSQKAQRTLFVNGIPPQNNKRELILSHFKKFGEITGISIPKNSE